jgi:hypothetical protein
MVGFAIGVLALGVLITSRYSPGTGGDSLLEGLSTPTQTGSLSASQSGATTTPPEGTESSATTLTEAGSGGGLSCFTDLSESSETTFTLGAATGYRLVFSNSSGGQVIGYLLPSVQASLAPGANLGYSLAFTDNSTYSGVYTYGELKGVGSIEGYAGIPGSSSYRTISSGTTDSILIELLVSGGAAGPYEIGVSNSSGSNQTVSMSGALLATCGLSWVSQSRTLG